MEELLKQFCVGLQERMASKEEEYSISFFSGVKIEKHRFRKQKISDEFNSNNPIVFIGAEIWINNILFDQQGFLVYFSVETKETDYINKLIASATNSLLLKFLLLGAKTKWQEFPKVINELFWEENRIVVKEFIKP